MEDSADKKTGFDLMLDRYKYLIGIFLLLVILSSSIFLLWRQNYFAPEIEKRVKVVESKIETLSQNKIANTLPSPVEVEKLIVDSKESTGSSGEDGKVAGASATSAQPKPAVVIKKVTAKININTASEAELDTLSGIGPAYAKRIIDYRQSHNGFKSIEQIKEVKGIGDSIFGKIKDLITI